ncbi:MAG: hypothetical protein AB2421_17825 [Thermotaleaceae bacterium]
MEDIYYYTITVPSSEFASRIGVSAHHIRKEATDKNLNAIKIASTYRFFEKEIQRYIHARETGTSSSSPIIITEDILKNLLQDYPAALSSKDISSFFNVTDHTARSFMMKLGSMKFGNRGGYKLRKEKLIQYILENQTTLQKNTSK